MEAGGFDALSISALARLYRKDRKTVAKLLAEMGAVPAGKERGNAVYALGNVTCLIGDGAAPLPGKLDPEEMHPKDRKDWYQGESERIELMRIKGELVPIEEVRREFAALAKALINELDNLPDILERDCNLDGGSRVRVQSIIDGARQRMFEALNDE